MVIAIAAMLGILVQGEGAGEMPRVPSGRETVTMNRDNVELTEAGRFEVDPAIMQGIAVPSDFTRDRAFKVELWFGVAGGSPLRCAPAASAPPELAKAICDAMMGSARFTFHRGFAQPIDRGFVQLYVYPSWLTGTPRIAVELSPAYAATDLRYPPDTTPEAEQLAKDAGVLDAGITPDSYPSTALRAALTGRSEVLLGISGDGAVATCRPVRSAGSAVLDNATCAVIVRRGRFTFAPTAKPYDGLRYKTVGVVWALPR